MNKTKDIIWLIIILLIFGGALWIVTNPDHPIKRGLDLQGGLQVLLEADVPADQTIEPEQMDTARQIIDQRVNALGVTEPLVQAEENRIIIELPGIENPEDAISLIQETALLEFVDSGNQPMPEGMCIRTTGNTGPSRCELEGASSGTPPTLETVMTGADMKDAFAERTEIGQYFVSFDLQPEAGDFFATYTRDHQGQFLTIVLDKVVISSPQINSVIDGGSGTITGQFTPEEAKKLALQLQFGSLPVPLKIESIRQVGATLGGQSVDDSIRAGIIGVTMVLIFMMAYYRLPGVLADLALLFYMLLNFAVYQAVPITLTLPAITGFLISTGMAVDANVLVFERIKEELAAGNSLTQAINTGFSRAWVAIRDSNVATLVICFILWMFGRSFGASAVQGFAITLAIGVLISMFTAVFVTRTLVNIVIGWNAKRFSKKSILLGS